MAWAPDYCTAAELKSYARINDTVDDAQVALAITAASRAIDGPSGCNRQFGLVAAPEARYYTAYYDRDLCKWALSIDDLMTNTGLLVAYDSAADSTYGTSISGVTPTPRNAVAKGRPWTSLIVHGDAGGVGAIDGGVRVTARWGWTTVPDTIKQATLMQANAILWRRESPAGIAGSPDSGSELRMLAKIDPTVKLMIKPYYRWWGAA
jgi:hypothetical protein